VVALWRLPEGVRVLADGSWRVGGFPILHAASLRHLKSRLVFEADQAFIEDGERRYRITKIAASPLPGDKRPCAYLLPA